MNDRQIENKVIEDIAKVNKDLSTLVGDGAVRFSKFEDNVSRATSKAKEDLSTWVEEGVNQLSEGIEKMTSDARATVVDAAAAVKKDVGHGLIQYNAKVQEAVDKVPGDFSKKAATYSWVVLSIALVIGLLLGRFLKPTRQPLG